MKRQQIPPDEEASERKQVQSPELPDALEEERPGETFTEVVRQRREDLFGQHHHIAQDHELEEAGQAPGAQTHGQWAPPEPDGKPNQPEPEEGIEKLWHEGDCREIPRPEDQRDDQPGDRDAIQRSYKARWAR
jgi:hypothetical protein